MSDRVGEHLRMSDADRDAAAAELAEHYAQGRLTTDEHAERLDRVWAARTPADLRPVFADLPGPHPLPSYAAVGRPGAPDRSGPRGRRFRGLPLPLVVLLVALVAVTVLAHLPIVLVGLLVWWLLARRGSCGRAHRARWS